MIHSNNVHEIKKPEQENEFQRPNFMAVLYATLITTISNNHDSLRLLAEQSSATGKAEMDEANSLSATNITPIEVHQHEVRTKVGFWEHFAFWNADAYRSEHVKVEDDLVRLQADNMDNAAQMNARALSQGRMAQLQQRDELNGSTFSTIGNLTNSTIGLSSEVNVFERKMTHKAILDPEPDRG